MTDVEGNHFKMGVDDWDIIGQCTASLMTGVHGAVIDKTMRDILAQQQTHMIQFESCLDEFNRYLTALRLLCALQ
jgi:hypothetical protein